MRALLIDKGGRPISSAERVIAAAHPHLGWSKQDPADWIAELDDAGEEWRRAHPAFARLADFGVAGRMYGETLLDAKCRLLRPCILWSDTCAHEEAAQLDAMPGLRDLSGDIVVPGSTAPQLEWIHIYELDTHARAAKLLLPAYSNLYPTGKHIADMSDSAGASWLDAGLGLAPTRRATT